jgi:hypothetical protein
LFVRFVAVSDRLPLDGDQERGQIAASCSSIGRLLSSPATCPGPYGDVAGQGAVGAVVMEEVFNVSEEVTDSAA